MEKNISARPVTQKPYKEDFHNLTHCVSLMFKLSKSDSKYFGCYDGVELSSRIVFSILVLPN